MRFSSKNLFLMTKDYIMIVVGIFLYAFGFTAFILPERVVIGGLAGVGSLVYFQFGVPVAITQYALNLFLLALAYKVVGSTFVIRTIFGATVISVFIGILQPIFSEPIVQQQAFMNVIIGAALCGVGVGLVFIHNGSTGGTDIVAAMVSKRSNVTIGRMMLYCDFVIISSSYLIFHQIDKIVYGFITLFIVSTLADMIINTNRQAVQFTIFSRHWEDIANAINNRMRRGCTVLTGMGWYSKKEVKVLLVMCRKIESVSMFRIIKSIDKDAFITQANVSGVYGQGFDEIKYKIKQKEEMEALAADRAQQPDAAAKARPKKPLATADDN